MAQAGYAKAQAERESANLFMICSNQLAVRKKAGINISNLQQYSIIMSWEASHQIGVIDEKSVVSRKMKNGKNLLTLSPKALTIIWGGTGSNDRYWRKNPDGAVELMGTTWLEVKCSLPVSKLSPNTHYQLSFTLKFDIEKAQGWNARPVIFCLRLPEKKTVYKRVDLSKALIRNEWTDVPDQGLEFSIKETNEDAKLEFAMYEIENDQWKRGLMIKEVKIKPKA
ncbi:hypothetical protein H6P81_019673 [Aristolochia fimbriata]|uniref:Phloem protein 2 n=1 Tax=Aristolochia fimbriata TaxID=158543 RepID=A0AAV7DSG5_ARIFI|nr:hypothetical protein H6P81_019673 [Aristolochia fimbriata]